MAGFNFIKKRTKRKIKNTAAVLVLLALMAGLIVAASLAAGDSDSQYQTDSTGDYSYRVSGDTAYIGEYLGSDTEVTVPETVDGYTVVEIEYLAFGYNTAVTSVDLSETQIETIAEAAFISCTSLTSVTFPETLGSIGDGAFQYCTALSSLDLPEGITEITWTCFQGCSALTEIELPETVTTIDYYAFADCTALEEIIIYESVTSIADYAFENDDSLTIYGYSGSYAQTYAQANSITFSALGESDCEHSYTAQWTWDIESDGVVTAVSAVLTLTCELCGDVQEIDADEITAQTTDASCVEDGVTVYTAIAAYDGTEYTDTCEVTIEAAGHTAGEAVIENEVEADCTEDGSYDSVVYCSVCGEELSRETVTVPATGHSYEAVAVTEPTCTEEGYTTYTCSVCGDEYTDDYVDATGHSWGEPVFVWEASESGLIEDYTCTATSTCENDETHVYVMEADVVVVKIGQAACADEGITYYLFADLLFVGDVYVDSYSITYTADHEYEASVTDPTCTEEGYITYTCSVCGDEYTDDYVEATGHSYEAAVTEATCTEDGYTTYTCSVCGDTYTDDYVEASGHSFGEWESVSSPSCEDEGILKRSCTVCGYTETESVEETGHSWEDDYTVDKEATCTEEGSKSIHCSVCGAVKDSVVIPALGHKYITQITKEATCTEDGIITGVCIVCLDTYTQIIPATGHSYDDGVVTKEATEDEEGEITYTCTVCGNTYIETVDKLGDDAFRVSGEIGDYVTMGTYEQDNNTEDGAEEIEWIIAAKEDGKALLVSRYCLDCVPFGSEGVLWESSYLKSWLNTTFAPAAFTQEELEALSEDGTLDVFILNSSEIEEYLSALGEEEAQPTQYAAANGSITLSDGQSLYWTTEGNSAAYRGAEVLGLVGGQDIQSSFISGIGVRVAVWVDCE